MENILITYLSKLPEPKGADKVSEITYKCGDNIKDIVTSYTNEAGIRFLKELLKQKNEKIDKIIAVCSGEVKTKKNSFFNDLTTLEYFEKLIDDCFHEAKIEIVDSKGKADNTEDVINIFPRLTDISMDSKIYLDITGGFRDSVYTLSLISRFIEFKGINIERVIYSMMANGKGKILNYTNNFRLTTLMNGMSEFVNFGNAKTISEYFKDSTNQQVTATIQSMNDFNDALSLGKTGELDNILTRLNDDISATEAISADDLSIMLFKEMIPVIKEKFFPNGTQIDYLSMIEWCSNNNLIQQALTLCTEKIPRYLFNAGYIAPSSEQVKEDANNKKRSYNDKYVDMLYTDIMNVSESDNLKSAVKPVRSGIAKLGNYKKTPIYQGLINYMEIYNEVKGVNLRDYFRKKNPTRNCANECVRNAWEILQKRDNIIDIAKINEKAFYGALLGLKASDKNVKGSEIENRINFIENFGKNIVSSEYKYNADKKELAKVFAGYVFLKSIRNIINHASEQDNLSDTQKAFFKQYGYEYNITTECLQRNIELIIKDIRNLKRV